VDEVIEDVPVSINMANLEKCKLFVDMTLLALVCAHPLDYFKPL